MDLDEQAEQIIKATPSRVQWSVLLLFYQNNRTELSTNIKRRLHIRSEEFRLMFSTQNDQIKREDVFPSELYEDQLPSEENLEVLDNSKAVNY